MGKPTVSECCSVQLLLYMLQARPALSTPNLCEGQNFSSIDLAHISTALNSRTQEELKTKATEAEHCTTSTTTTTSWVTTEVEPEESAYLASPPPHLRSKSVI